MLAVLLHVTGKLGPPTMLNYSIIDDHVLFEWKPPFSLSDIWNYTVVVTGESEGASPIASVNTTELNYFLPLAMLSANLCTTSYMFILNVSAINFAGEGDISNIQVHIPQDDKFCPTTLKGAKASYLHTY